MSLKINRDEKLDNLFAKLVGPNTDESNKQRDKFLKRKTPKKG